MGLAWFPHLHPDCPGQETKWVHLPSREVPQEAEATRASKRGSNLQSRARRSRLSNTKADKASLGNNTALSSKGQLYHSLPAMKFPYYYADFPRRCRATWCPSRGRSSRTTSPGWCRRSSRTGTHTFNHSRRRVYLSNLTCCRKPNQQRGFVYRSRLDLFSGQRIADKGSYFEIVKETQITAKSFKTTMRSQVKPLQSGLRDTNTVSPMSSWLSSKPFSKTMMRKMMSMPRMKSSMPAAKSR